jgi:Uma2 family endonuclease
VAVFFAGKNRPPARGLVRTPPDVAIEVVSTSRRDERRDREEKLAEYESFGVRWYSIVDPQRRSVQIHGLAEGGRYRLALECSSGSIAEVPGCSGLSLDVDALWSKADALGVEA